MSQAEFINQSTAQALGLDVIWRRLETVTPFGRPRPIDVFGPDEASALEAEWQQVERVQQIWQTHGGALHRLRHILQRAKDIRHSLERAEHGLTLDVVELFEIKRFLGVLEEVSHYAQVDMWPVSGDLVPPYPDALACALDPGGRKDPSFYIDASFSGALRRIRTLKRRLTNRIDKEKKRLHREVERELGMPLGLEGELVVSRGDEREQAAFQLPQLVLEKETSSHSFFRVRPRQAVLSWQGRLERLTGWEQDIEHGVRQGLSREVARAAPVLRQGTESLGRLDILLAKALLSHQWQGVRPRLATAGLCVAKGRHPLVEEDVSQQGHDYTPVSLTMLPGVTLITGPNMGGKTKTLETVGLLVALAQHGFMVPAAAMTFSPRRFVFYQAGDSTVPSGLSAFAQELEATKSLLDRRWEPGLALIDEFARSTNPAEGRALAAALAAELGDSELLTLFVTHYEGLAPMSGAHQYQVRGLAGMALFPGAEGLDSLYRYMDYRLERVDANTPVPHHALEIGRMLGLDARLLERARAFLREEER